MGGSPGAREVWSDAGREARRTGDILMLVERSRAGKVHPILLWLLGVPIPVIILLLLFRGCMH